MSKRALLTPMTMRNTVGSVRFADDVWARIEEHRSRLQGRVGASVQVTMVDTVRDLVMVGLSAEGEDGGHGNHHG